MLPPKLPEILDRLEVRYGAQQQPFPAGVFEALVWWHCGYPPSDVACTKGWNALLTHLDGDVNAERLLELKKPKLGSALKAGGLIPDVRTDRLREIASAVRDQFNGSLDEALRKLPAAECRKILMKFPGIGGPGADRLMLFNELAPVAAVPSNSPYVLVRILHGKPDQKYQATYRLARQAIEAAVPETVAARSRAYLLLKRHGQELCKWTKPKCAVCPVNDVCAMVAQSA
jgi:endonuclease III